MRFLRWECLAILGLAAVSPAALKLTIVGSAAQWKRAEFKIAGVPTVSNPFDPEVVAVDATITAPSGAKLTVPAFWFQEYARKKSKTGAETLTATGAPEWRLRFLPTEVGKHAVTLSVKLSGQALPTLASSFSVSPTKASDPVGVARVAAGGQTFETTHGDPLPLSGLDVAYGFGATTYDFDRWFGKMADAGQNWARVFMSPWHVGIEHDKDALNRYRLDQAWKLDYELSLAEQKGILVQLSLDDASAFNPTANYGVEARWSGNPYNVVNGGPCLTQDDFFTSLGARKLYQNRLRYLIARYGASPKLFAWEFYDQLDFDYLPFTPIEPGHATAWLGSVSAWLKANDPFRHLVTVGMTNADHGDVWSLPGIDYIGAQSYSLGDPGQTIAEAIRAIRAPYAKPSFASKVTWDAQYDPYLRGLRQALWGAAVGGGVGTPMMYTVRGIESPTIYPPYAKLRKTLGATAWGTGPSIPLAFGTVDEAESIGDAIPGGAPFSVTIPLDAQWAAPVPGTLALPSPDLAGRGASRLRNTLLGAWFPQQQRPFRLIAWYGQNAKFTVHVDAVAGGSILRMKIDGQVVSETTLPDKDGLAILNGEYNQDFTVSVPAGKHTIELENGSNGWIGMNWVSVANALPAQYTGSLVATGSRYAKETLAYVVSPTASYPVNAGTKSVASTTGAKLTILNVPAGTYVATWTRPVDGTAAGVTTATVIEGTLTLTVPTFSEDLFVRIVKK